MAAVLFALVISFGELEMTIFLISPSVTTLPVAVLQYLNTMSIHSSPPSPCCK